jgi:hypothetical protein
MLDMGGYGSGARWHLDLAIRDNNVELAAWCLAHGASANAAPPSATVMSPRSLHEEAAVAGSQSSRGCSNVMARGFDRRRSTTGSGSCRAV